MKLAGPTQCPGLEAKAGIPGECGGGAPQRVMWSMGQRCSARSAGGMPAAASRGSRSSPWRSAAPSTVFTQLIDTVACRVNLNGL